MIDKDLGRLGRQATLCGSRPVHVGSHRSLKAEAPEATSVEEGKSDPRGELLAQNEMSKAWTFVLPRVLVWGLAVFGAGLVVSRAVAVRFAQSQRPQKGTKKNLESDDVALKSGEDRPFWVGVLVGVQHRWRQVP